MPELLTLDSVGEDAGNAPLELMTPGDGSLAVSAMAFPTPNLDTAMAGSIDTEGDSIAARRHQNRSVSLTVEVTEPSDAAATNMVLNPSAEIDTTNTTNTGNYLGAGTSTIARSTAASSVGDASFLMTTSAANQGMTLTLSGTHVNGQVYSGSVYVRGQAGGETVRAFLGTQTAGQVGSVTAVTASASSWTRIDCSWTPSADRTDPRLYVQLVAAGGVYVDAATVVSGATVGSVFDGDTPGCAWTGARHASSSTRPASGGARFKAILQDLEAKVAKIAREGGTLRKTDSQGNVRTLDLLAADRYEPTFDVKYVLAGAATVDVGLLAKPYARGAEQTLSTHTETTSPVLVFTETGIQGDVPALGRVVITEQGAANQKWLTWGVRSRYYSSSTPLFWEGESMELASGVASTAVAGASAGNVAQQTLDTAPVPLVGASSLTHTGTYRLYARVRTTSAASGDVSVWSTWSPGFTGPILGVGEFGLKTDNQPAVLSSSLATSFVILDLGLLTFPVQLSGTRSRAFLISASAAAATGSIGVDCVWLVPADEGSGIAQGTSTLPPALLASGTAELSSSGYVIAKSGSPSIYAAPGSYSGDYLLVPVAGPEGYTAQFIIKASRNVPQTSSDPNIDDLSARLYYTPRYLSML